MLLAVEGGGFFSSSASGYSKGLTLLLLGHSNEEKPMRVSPWNQYQLVEQESDPDFSLASAKNHLPRGCASFICFGRTSAGLEVPSPLKVGPTEQQDTTSPPPFSDKDEDHSADCESDNHERKLRLKSSLKKRSVGIKVASEGGDECEVTNGKEGNGSRDISGGGQTERRKVQWTDACGKELIEIREFEPSEAGSDDEYGNGRERTCSCAIM